MKMLEYKGETHNICEWARITGIGRATISARLRKGWSVGQALSFEKRLNNTIIERGYNPLSIFLIF